MNWATLLLITVLLTHTLTSDASDVIDDVVDDEEELEEEEMVIPDAKVNLRFNYHNYTALTAFLNDVAAAYPQLTQLYSIGKSVQGYPFHSIQIEVALIELKLVRSRVVGAGRFIDTSRPRGR